MQWLVGLLAIAVAVVIYVLQRRSTQRVEVVNPESVQQFIPYVRLIFQKAPDKVLLENIGTGIAAKALLQGFIFKDDQGESWHCTFETVHTIQANKIAPVRLEIENPKSGATLSDRAIFHIAFRHALHVLNDTPLILNLVSQDILGNCYESQVHVHSTDWYMGWKQGMEQRWAAVTSAPVRIKRWPETFPALDTSR
jgi:hypothetical protein